jgi:hypothetical protein
MQRKEAYGETEGRGKYVEESPGCDKEEETKGMRWGETGGETKCGLSEVCSKKGRHRDGNSKWLCCVKNCQP